jgi:Zn-dependent M28 family amino/carboxypeptidase
LPGTCEGTISGRLIDVGFGRPGDFEAKDVREAIVMASSESPADHHKWIHRMEKYSEAVDRGAVGFVFYGHLDGCLPPTGEIGYQNRPAPIPGVGVSKEVGHDLKRFAEAVEPILEIDVDCRHQETTSQNVEGVLGPDSDMELLVTAHVDAHDISQGAGDNGVGCTIVTEVARLLAQVDERLGTAVRFVGFGAEEMGLRGALHWTETNSLEDIVAILNIDGVGAGRQLEVNSNGFEPLGSAFERCGEELGLPVDTISNVSPHGDQWEFVQEGVPGAMIGTSSDGGRRWGHTHADTFDKIDFRNLREFAVVIASAVFELSRESDALDHKTPAAVRDQLDAGYRQELRVSDRWPWSVSHNES